MNITRRRLIQTASLAFLDHCTRGLAAESPLLESIEKVVVPAPEVKDGAWFHPRSCLAGKKAFMTLQPIMGSDYFGPLQWTTSDDLGKTWSPFQEVPPL